MRDKVIAEVTTPDGMRRTAGLVHKALFGLKKGESVRIVVHHSVDQWKKEMDAQLEALEKSVERLLKAARGS